MQTLQIILQFIGAHTARLAAFGQAFANARQKHFYILIRQVQIGIARQQLGQLGQILLAQHRAQSAQAHRRPLTVQCEDRAAHLLHFGQQKFAGRDLCTHLADHRRVLEHGRHQLLLDLTKPEVRDYLVESVGGILDSAPISYVKWDMNRHSCALGAQQHAFVLGLYDVLRRIFLPRPQILLESCSSGGNRFDCGMLWFSPQIWCSDDTDPVERLRIQQSLSFLYPPSCFGTHVSASPHAQTLRHTPLSTRGNVSLFGCLGYELDLTELLPVEQAEIRAQTEFYRAHRRTLQYGRFTRGRTDGGGTVWQMQTKQETVAAVFHGLQPAAPGYEHLCVTGLDGEKQYRLTSRPQLLRVGDFGTLLRHVLPVKLNPNGLAVQTADSLYRMSDGSQSLTASGAAFAAGICLAPRFAGTGYDPDGRMQGDFGSNVYFIQEVCSHEKP